MQIGIGRRFWAPLVAFAACFILGEGRAQAQFGYGFGFGAFNYHPSEVGYLNQKSLLNASQATMGPVQHNVYAGNPNAYINHLYDPGYLDKYDVGTRRTIEASIGRYSDGPPPGFVEHHPAPRPSPGMAAAAPAPPSIPLSSFFDRYSKLVWPDESPNNGDLAAKRGASDLASLAVLNEYNLRGLAGVGTVTDARAKLLDYGRPALQYIRDNSTPRIADGFHLFLLSLYESLAQAATIPKPAAATPVNTPRP
jgi:hypothetical protein